MSSAQQEQGNVYSEGFGRRDVPLVPPDAIAIRALVTVIAIMTFLASLTAGTAVLVSDVSRGWRQDVAREMSIQLKPVTGRNIELDIKKVEEIARATPGVKDVTALSPSESERLLEPWLGTGLDLKELPVPRMIVLKLASDTQIDLAKLRTALSQNVPGSNLDDHRQWIDRLTVMSRTTVLVAIVIFGLVLVAMALAVAFATRGAMAGSREVINVLHFVGAEDAYIARQFQRHFLWLGLRGGLIGGGLAIATFLTGSLLSHRWISGMGGDQLEAMFGTFSLGFFGYAVITFIGGSVSILTGITSRSVVFRHLRGLT
jgi:cell division transport system permease protein